jgi:hypothetical protein
MKPELHYLGKILGCDVYIDSSNPKKRELAEKVLYSALKRLDESFKPAEETQQP